MPDVMDPSARGNPPPPTYFQFFLSLFCAFVLPDDFVENLKLNFFLDAAALPYASLENTVAQALLPHNPSKHPVDLDRSDSRELL